MCAVVKGPWGTNNLGGPLRQRGVMAILLACQVSLDMYLSIYPSIYPPFLSGVFFLSFLLVSCLLCRMDR
jgi:hypothetical protein